MVAAADCNAVEVYALGSVCQVMSGMAGEVRGVASKMQWVWRSREEGDEGRM